MKRRQATALCLGARGGSANPPPTVVGNTNAAGITTIRSGARGRSAAGKSCTTATRLRWMTGGRLAPRRPPFGAVLTTTHPSGGLARHNPSWRTCGPTAPVTILAEPRTKRSFSQPTSSPAGHRMGRLLIPQGAQSDPSSLGSGVRAPGTEGHLPCQCLVCRTQPPCPAAKKTQNAATSS